MLKSHFKVALRNLSRNKMHTFINITGLSAGMAVAILIGLWIWDELSFDKYNSQYDRIALVMQNQSNNGQVGTYNTVPFPLANELRDKYGSDFKQVVMGFGANNHVLTFGDKIITQTGSYFEAGAPDLMDLKMLRGSRAALKDPNSIILSASVAKAYFGETDPVNQIMKIDMEQAVKVTGVYKDLPHNSSFADMGYIATWQLLYDSWGLKDRKNPWRLNAFKLYVQLADKTELATVSTKIKDAKLRNMQEADALSKPQLFLQPMRQWHLYADFKNGVNAGGKIRYVWMCGIIGVFVLLLACINFMNLSTARYQKRAKEVGVRKAMGAPRRQLILQFFSESLLMTAFAFVGALLLVLLILPFFNQIADKQIEVLWSNPMFWLIGIGFSFITGIIAGSYPALYLSSFRPVKALKGIFTARFAAIPRKALIVLQFTVSVVLESKCTISAIKCLMRCPKDSCGTVFSCPQWVQYLSGTIVPQFRHWLSSRSGCVFK
jgi:putative ABC transport system permease protein